MSDINLPGEILKRLQNVLPAGRDFIALHEPTFQGEEWTYVKKCLDTGWVSYAGEFVQEFDKRLAEYCGVKHAVCVSSGTAALHMALKVADVQDGDEVLIPALTFVATANAVKYLNATPHFVDSDETSLGIDPAKLDAHLSAIAESNDKGECINRKTGQRIAAIIPVHVFGHPCAMDEIIKIAGQYNITVITDAVESLGSLYKGKPAASHGQLSTLSFNGNKIITTGGGGAVLTDDDELAARLRHITTTAKAPHKYRFIHDEVGYNYRMPNINAALGCAGLEQIESFLASKRTLAQKYEIAFKDLNSLSVFKEPDFATSNYWLNTLILDESAAGQLEDILEITNDNGIMTRPAWDLMSTLKMYRTSPAADLETAENLAQRIINIPSSPTLVS